MVVNTTKVIPARIRETRETGGQQEVLLVAPRPDLEGLVWEAWVRPGKRFRLGMEATVAGHEVKVIEVLKDGARLLRFDCTPEEFQEMLQQRGAVPLPPYIKRDAEEEDREAYQAIFAKHDGAVAAPTASLHFSQQMLDALVAKGVIIAEVTLHVGPGTFQPIGVEDAREHPIHGERFFLTAQEAEKINRAAATGGRVIAIGTTVARVIETVADEEGVLCAAEGITHKYIYPGYRWKRVDGLVTNFHWPKSTLLLLVSAFYGRENLLEAYREAFKAKMRLFSYGDGMVIL
jgi:S-adenosylmethionine:tRNA ribosyltransferase-isomerase